MAIGNENLAIGTSYGTEKMLHSARIFRECRPDLDSSSSDYKNAFQNMNRSSVLNQMAISVPLLLDTAAARLGDVQQVWYYGLEGGHRSCGYKVFFFFKEV